MVESDSSLAVVPIYMDSILGPRRFKSVLEFAIAQLVKSEKIKTIAVCFPDDCKPNYQTEIVDIIQNLDPTRGSVYLREFTSKDDIKSLPLDFMRKLISEFSSSKMVVVDPFADGYVDFPILSSKYNELLADLSLREEGSIVSCKRHFGSVWSGNEADPKLLRESGNPILLEDGACHVFFCKDFLEHESFIIDPVKCLEIERSDGNSNSKRISTIKCVLTDIDGVLTDGGLYYAARGNEIKRFHARDGIGFRLLKELKLQTGIITGAVDICNKKRAEKLKVDAIIQGSKNKVLDADRLRLNWNLKWEEIAYIGDDTNCLGLLKKVGWSACPSDAHPDVLASVNYICEFKGGSGCFREFADQIILEHREEKFKS